MTCPQLCTLSQLRSHSGEQYPVAEVFTEEITKRYQEREQQREERRI
jgi:hypothetical protein